MASFPAEASPRSGELARRGDEVVEAVLLSLAAAGAVPLLAVLPAAAQIGDRVDASHLEPERNPGLVTGRHARAVPAVGRQEGRASAVGPQASLRGQKHRDAGSVLRREEDLPRLIGRGVERNLRGPEGGARAPRQVVPVNGLRREERAEGVPELGRRAAPIQRPSDGSDSGKRDLPGALAGEREEAQPAPDVRQIVHGEAVARHGRALDHVGRFGDDRARPRRRAFGQIERDHAPPRRIEIRRDIEDVPRRAHGRVARLASGEKRHQRRCDVRGKRLPSDRSCRGSRSARARRRRWLAGRRRSSCVEPSISVLPLAGSGGRAPRLAEDVVEEPFLHARDAGSSPAFGGGRWA